MCGATNRISHACSICPFRIRRNRKFWQCSVQILGDNLMRKNVVLNWCMMTPGEDTKAHYWQHENTRVLTPLPLHKKLLTLLCPYMASRVRVFTDTYTDGDDFYKVITDSMKTPYHWCPCRVMSLLVSIPTLEIFLHCQVWLLSTKK